jgi:hypothetical protein
MKVAVSILWGYLDNIDCSTPSVDVLQNSWAVRTHVGHLHEQVALGAVSTVVLSMGIIMLTIPA